MKEGQLEKTKYELEKKHEENQKQVKLYNNRSRILKVNSSDEKLLNSIGWSMLVYIPLILIFIFVGRNPAALATLLNIIPGDIIPIIMIGISVISGTAITNNNHKRNKIKERIASFTSAKTDVDLLKEEIEYEIEKEKLINRNLVIKETLQKTDSNQLVLQKISEIYDINKKEFSLKEIQEISEILNKNYEELDDLTTNKILYEKFYGIKNKLQKSQNIGFNFIIPCFFTMITILPPLLILVKNISLIGCFSSLFGSAIIGGMVSGVSYLKKSKNYKKVFDEYYKYLKDDFFDEENYISEEIINKKIDSISTIESKIQELKLVENISNVKKELTESTKNKETVKDINKNLELHSENSIETKTKNIYNEEILIEELHSEEKGKTLIKK